MLLYSLERVSVQVEVDVYVLVVIPSRETFTALSSSSITRSGRQMYTLRQSSLLPVVLASCQDSRLQIPPPYIENKSTTSLELAEAPTAVFTIAIL